MGGRRNLGKNKRFRKGKRGKVKGRKKGVRDVRRNLGKEVDN